MWNKTDGEGGAYLDRASKVLVGVSAKPDGDGKPFMTIFGRDSRSAGSMHM